MRCVRAEQKRGVVMGWAVLVMVTGGGGEE